MSIQTVEQSQLGKDTVYSSDYEPSLLFPIPREEQRKQIGIPSELPFRGIDLWNAYELSWLNGKGKPEVAIAEFSYPCHTPNIIESKSFKLYLNSLNQKIFSSKSSVLHTLKHDLSNVAGGEVFIKLIFPEQNNASKLEELPGYCLDALDITCDTYTYDPELLKLESEGETLEEQLTTHLLKSNCPVTGQPDWASLWIHYHGPKINHEGLLKYIISLRMMQEFHEPCVERIYVDILRRCQPQKLTVYGRYTRRGGLDINPFRSNFESVPSNTRSIRQ
jgi:7-cyano-7-deazaguanine reductase